MKYAANDDAMSRAIVIALKVSLKLKSVRNRLIRLKIIIKKFIINTGSSRIETLEVSSPQNEKLPNRVIKSELRTVTAKVEVDSFITEFSRI